MGDFMKKIWILSLFALLLLSACAEPSVQTEVLPAPAEIQIDAEPTVPAEDETEDRLPQQPVFDPITVQTEVESGYYDEVCSYRFEKPRLGAQYAEFNAYYDDLIASLKQTASGTVYDTASENFDVADVTGTFASEQSDGLLTVTYTVTVHYGKQPLDETHTLTDVFDLASGKRLEENAS